MSTPMAIVSEACGSRSIANTERPCSMRAAATLRVLVVLAVPPFWLKNATIRVIRRATEDVRTSKRIAQRGAKLARHTYLLVRAISRGAADAFHEAPGDDVAEACGIDLARGFRM